MLVRVIEEIEKSNPWYVGSQFEWAEKASIRPIYEKRYEYFIECIERAKTRLGPRLRLLDAGCGDGYWLYRLSALKDLRLYGVDYNPLRVERAKQVVPLASISCSDLMCFEAEEPFDVILLSQVMEHVEDDIGLLHRMQKVLRSSGVLVLGTPNEGSWLHRWRNRRTWKRSKTDHVHSYTEKQVRRKLMDAGFCIDSIMREVFYIGSERLCYWLTERSWGFQFLSIMSRLWPSECSDFYFECSHLKGQDEKDGQQRSAIGRNSV